MSTLFLLCVQIQTFAGIVKSLSWIKTKPSITFEILLRSEFETDFKVWCLMTLLIKTWPHYFKAQNPGRHFLQEIFCSCAGLMMVPLYVLLDMCSCLVKQKVDRNRKEAAEAWKRWAKQHTLPSHFFSRALRLL